MMGGAKAHYDGIVAFSQTDFTEDLKKITVPVLVMHGDDDQIVPYADSGPLSARLVQNGTLKTYPGFPHGMPTTQAQTINADLLAFVQSCPARRLAADCRSAPGALETGRGLIRGPNVLTCMCALAPRQAGSQRGSHQGERLLTPSEPVRTGGWRSGQLANRSGRR